MNIDMKEFFENYSSKTIDFNKEYKNFLIDKIVTLQKQVDDLKNRMGMK